MVLIDSEGETATNNDETEMISTVSGFIATNSEPSNIYDAIDNDEDILKTFVTIIQEKCDRRYHRTSRLLEGCLQVCTVDLYRLIDLMLNQVVVRC